MSILSKEFFHDEAAAVAHVESMLWPDGPVCPHCGSVDDAKKIDATPPRRKLKKDGKVVLDKNGEPVWKVSPMRHGLYRCRSCNMQFTVRKGTIFEESKLPMHKWLQAIYLMASSKKGFSAHQLHRTLECQYKTAWFLFHRLREAMRSDELRPFGAGGGTVEVDETYIGHDPLYTKRRSFVHKNKVLALVDRDSGQTRSVHMEHISMPTITPILQENIAREARVITDQAGHYKQLNKHFDKHEAVNHSKFEYVSKTDPTITTNTIESVFSVFKRGMKGTYQHCAAKHLHRYLAEFDFRYNNRVALGVDDSQRATRLLQGVVGKRLTYGPVGLGR